MAAAGQSFDSFAGFPPTCSRLCHKEWPGFRANKRFHLSVRTAATRKFPVPFGLFCGHRIRIDPCSFRLRSSVRRDKQWFRTHLTLHPSQKRYGGQAALSATECFPPQPSPGSALRDHRLPFRRARDCARGGIIAILLPIHDLTKKIFFASLARPVYKRGHTNVRCDQPLQSAGFYQCRLDNS